MAQDHTGPLAERQRTQGLLDVDDRRYVGVVHALRTLPPEESHSAALPDGAADAAARHVGDDTAGVRGRVVGGPHPVPAVPERDQGVRCQIVRGVLLAGQQVGEAGEFGVVPLEEVMELRGGCVVDCPHG